MRRLRALTGAALILGLASVPVKAANTAKTTAFGTVIEADRAHIGQTSADVGTTVYGGDRLSTDAQGSIQLRAGAARLLLQSASAVVVDDSEGAPAAKLLLGTATFSTGNAHAFTLYASKAVVRAETDRPTIGQVTYVNEKELLVTARRGELAVTVDGETQVIAEGSTYRVLMDTADTAQGPAGAGAGGGGGQGKGSGGAPLKAGRSQFLIVITALTAAAAGIAISEALESPSRP